MPSRGYPVSVGLVFGSFGSQGFAFRGEACPLLPKLTLVQFGLAVEALSRRCQGRSIGSKAILLSAKRVALGINFSTASEPVAVPAFHSVAQNQQPVAIGLGFAQSFSGFVADLG